MQVLGVARTATHAEIRKAYKQLALRLHPDKPGGDEEMFKLVSGAYEVRTNAHVRTEGACWLPTRATSHSAATHADAAITTTRILCPAIGAHELFQYVPSCLSGVVKHALC